MAQRLRREKQQLARLCDLVGASLLPLLEPKPPRPQLTREDERRILLALSRVNKVIRGWEEEQGCEFDQEIVSCSGNVHSCCLPPDQHFDYGLSCLANIVSILDDMLFSVLLQLLDAPLISLKIDSMETKWTSELIDAKLFSSIFDPVHIFHLLLLLLHYDHLVLVDYLISKDVGVHCAQYLLRFIRKGNLRCCYFLHQATDNHDV